MRVLKRLGLMSLMSCLLALSGVSIAQAGPYKSMTLHYGGIEWPALFPVFYPEGFVVQNTVHPDQATGAEKPVKGDLKRGESEIINILHLVELGDGSIEAAAKKARIKKIHYVESEPFKVNIWYLFYKRQKTVVYGE